LELRQGKNGAMLVVRRGKNFVGEFVPTPAAAGDPRLGSSAVPTGERIALG
jgi:hypothetical protein